MEPKAHVSYKQRSGTREQQSERKGGEGLSALARLQRAMERHAALQDDVSSILKPRAVPTEEKAVPSAFKQQGREVQSEPASMTTASANASNSVAALAEQLQNLWYHEPRDASDFLRRRATEEVVSDSDTIKEDEDAKRAGDAPAFHQQHRQHVASATPMGSSSSLSPPPPLANALLKIGSDEKDELLVHLLQQVAFFREQLSEVATLGETIAAQLVHQQVRYVNGLHLVFPIEA